MASEFDDIFGDLKEDEQFSATLPSDFDEASIFGDSPSVTTTSSSSVYKPQEVSKPTAEPSVDVEAVAQHQEHPRPPASSAKPLWEQIGNTEQDDFLSWLDDGAEAPPSDSQSPPAAAPGNAPEAGSGSMDDISLDTPRSAAIAESVPSESPPVQRASGEEAASAVMAPPALPIHVRAAAAAQEISLDDDDDDDDFLEKIVENAKKKANSNSRESSTSSLQIKSQSSSLQRVPVLDFEALLKDCRETGVIPAASRLATWRHALQNGVILDSWVASMFEFESYRDFDFLMKVWDCCLLVGSGSSNSNGSSPSREYASTCMCFIVVHLIASRAGKKLLRFAGALKTSGKTLMNPADSLKDSTKWLMKKTNSSNSSGADQQAKTGAPPSSQADHPSMTGDLPNFNKLRTSLAAMGSESLDLLKKAEQAAVAKTRVPFGGGGASSTTATKPSSAVRTGAAASASTGSAASRTGSRSGMFKGRGSCDVTTFADTYCTMAGCSPFADKSTR